METTIAIAESVRRGERRAVEVLEDCLMRISSGNAALTAFVHVDADLAMSAARSVDAAIAQGVDPGPLAGVPFGVKDLQDCAGMPTAHGSLLFKGGPPKMVDEPQVARLRMAGAVPVGKTAASEFGMDSATTTRAFGTTRNPWNPTLTPGGSSGGSAAAVAAGLVPFATGSDSGGSVRSPAAFTGLVGLKPSHGRVPRSNGDSDLNNLGVLTTTVADTARLLDVTCGHAACDKMSLPAPGLNYEHAIEQIDVAGLRAVWSPDLGFAPVEREVVAVARAAAEALVEEARLQWCETSPAFTNDSAVWLTLACAELYSWLDSTGLWPATAGQLCDLTRWAVEYGEKVTVRDLWAAQRARSALEAEVAAFFSAYDVLLTPAVACPAFAAEGPIPAIIDGRDASATGAEPLSGLANLSWVPAISVPAGMTADGLPVGLQIVARHHADHILLRLARLHERARPWPRLATPAQR